MYTLTRIVSGVAQWAAFEMWRKSYSSRSILRNKFQKANKLGRVAELAEGTALEKPQSRNALVSSNLTSSANFHNLVSDENPLLYTIITDIYKILTIFLEKYKIE